MDDDSSSEEINIYPETASSIQCEQIVTEHSEISSLSSSVISRSFCLSCGKYPLYVEQLCRVLDLF